MKRRSTLVVACVALLTGTLLASTAAAQIETVPPVPDREPHHVRQLLETALFMGIGTAWYFSGQELNSPDWDLEVTQRDLTRKFFTTEEIRFDNNSFLFNQAYHPLSYGGIYLTARANNLGPWVSFGYAFFSSLLWEYVGELREKVSINDQIVSPLTGMAWGEVAYNWGEYFNSPESEGKIARKVLTGVFGLPRLFHDWLDDAEPYLEPIQRFHFEPIFRVAASARTPEEGKQARGFAVTELDSKMAVMPGYGDQGRGTKFFHDGNFSELQAEIAFSDEIFELDVDANATITGIYHRDIDAEGRGYDVMVGGGRGYRILSRQGEQQPDRLGLLHVLGPNVWFRTFGPGNLRIETRLWAYFDFVAIQSLAVPGFVETYGEETFARVRTDIQKQSYYFGAGFTVAPSLHLHLGRYALELGTEIVRVHSIQGLDRFQEKVDRVIILDDLWWETDARLVIPTPLQWLNTVVHAKVVQRQSKLDELRSERVFREARLGLEARF